MDYENENYLPPYNGIDKIAYNRKQKYISFVFGLLVIIFGINEFIFKNTFFESSYLSFYIWFILLIGSFVINGITFFNPSGTLIINIEGVKSESKDKGMCKSFTWDEIKSIGIGLPSSISFFPRHYIYFFTIDRDSEYLPGDYLSNPNVIAVKFNPKIAHCALKYWVKEIKNLDTMKSWKRYVDKL